VCIDPRALRFSSKIILGIFAVGIPASVQNLLNVTGMTVLNNFTSDFGESAIAAMGIVQKINMLPVQIALGFSQGIMPLVSYNYASGNSARMKQSVMFTAKIMLVFLTAVTVFYYIFSGTLTELFMEDPEVVAYGTRFLRGFCLGIPFLCIDFLAVGIFQSCGFGSKALLFAILRKIVLEIPALFLLNKLFPLYGLAYAQLTAEVILAAAAVIVVMRIFKAGTKQT
ncbi:MAG: MATE family efflux transporter, partial [Oscillospiraceae bacterium]|nr:MATE family efflux transporter [Oscillospiraceae bacterium]